MTTVTVGSERAAERTRFGHPIGLANLFGVELWERFSFYGILTILGYYLHYSVTDGGLELSRTIATGIVGAYGGLVYLSRCGSSRSRRSSLSPGPGSGTAPRQVHGSSHTALSAWALYFLSVGIGTSISGILSHYYNPSSEFTYFGSIGAIAIAAGLVLFVLTPWVSRHMEGVH